LVVVAGICSVLAIVVGVSAVGEGIRYRGLVRGRLAAAIGLALAIALALGTIARGADDWEDLDVPAAYERVDLGGDGETLVDQIDAARQPLTDAGDRVRRGGQVGECYAGPVVAPGATVPCDEPHRLEVLLVVEPTGSAPDQGEDERRELARDACRAADGDVVDLPEGVGLDVLVPLTTAWAVGDTRSLCLAVSDEPRTGSVPR
jgi:hypothetical protein